MFNSNKVNPIGLLQSAVDSCFDARFYPYADSVYQQHIDKAVDAINTIMNDFDRIELEVGHNKNSR